MKQKLLISLLFIILSVNTIATSCVAGGNHFVGTQYQDSISFRNDMFSLVLLLQDDSIKVVKLKNRNNNKYIQGYPQLILVGGEIPEGTFREDLNNPNDIVGYECGPAYEVYTKDCQIVFALEKDTINRLDLLIYDSNNPCIPDGEYTLIKER